MSGQSTREGRQSFSPTPVSVTGTWMRPVVGVPRPQDGGGLASMRSPLPRSESLGNLPLRSSSEGASSYSGHVGTSSSANANNASGGTSTAAAVEKKGRKKASKRMKGWAWVVEDENGNVVDVPSEEDTAGRSGAAVAGTALTNTTSPNPNAAGAPGGAEHSSVAAASSAPTIGMNTPREPREEEKHVKSAGRPPKSRASTVGRDDTVLGKRVHKSTSPSMVVSPSNGNNGIPPPGHQAPPAQSTKPTEQDGHRSKVPRRSSPSAVSSVPIAAANLPDFAAPFASRNPPTVPPIPIASTSVPPVVIAAPSAPTSKSAPLRRQPARQPAAAAASAVAGMSAARSRLLTRDRDAVSRASSAHVVDDDTPLAIPPRSGMGDGTHFYTKESALRDEIALRREAMYMIDEAEKKRTLSFERGRGSGDGRGRMRNRKRKNWNIEVDKDDDFVVGGNVPNGYDCSEDEEWDSEIGPSRRNNTRTSIKAPPAHPSPRSFEEEFADIQNWYRRKAAEARAMQARRPPDLTKRPDPVVILATNGKPTFASDRTEKGYLKSLSGLTADMEADAQGFLQNVRANLTAIATYYFPQRTAKRDAFLDRIGRGLQRLGQELTDNGDAAVLP